MDRRDNQFLEPERGTGMDRRNNQFLEPERGTGMMGWAVKQLVFWLIGGFIVYTIAVNYQRFGSSAPDVRPEPTVADRSDSAPGDTPREELHPLGQAAPIVTNSLNLQAQPDGYAWVDAAVNGVPVKMAFDTGASFVSLTETDAARAGVAGNLNYTIPIWTANGGNPGAPVVLREVRIGQLVILDVNAIVQRHLVHSLLGQTFLKRLQSYQMSGGVLTLTWQQ